MKIFNNENGKEKVYVQMNDIMFLMNETDIPIPASIITKVFTDVVIVTDSNRFEFVDFDEVDVVKFFKKLDWIIDYSTYKSITDEELELEAKKLADGDKVIVDKYNAMSIKERKKNSKLLHEHETIVYKMQFLNEIYALKHGEREMTFPDFVKEQE